MRKKTNLTVFQDGSERIHYSDPKIPIYVVRGDLISLTGMAALCHWHEDLELLLPLEGYLNYNVNGTQVQIETGEAVLVNSRQMHYGYTRDGSDCQYICITFRPQLICANEEIQRRFVEPVITSLQFTHMVLRRSQPEQAVMLDCVMQLDALYREKKPGYELRAMAVLHAFWDALYRQVGDVVGEAASADPNVLVQKKMLDFIRTHYQEKISLDDIAAAGAVCRTRCCQIFKKYLGRTPNEYLNSYRMEQAMYLLRSTNISITEIAGSCGYGSISYFTELFTRTKGCTPTKYRKQ